MPKRKDYAINDERITQCQNTLTLKETQMKFIKPTKPGDVIRAGDIPDPDLWVKGRVCMTDLTVYNHLKWHAWNGHAYPKRKTLLDAILSKLPLRLNGKPRLTIDGLRKSIRRLERRYHLIQVGNQGLKRLPDGTYGRSNIVDLLFHPWMVEPKPERFRAHTKKSTTQKPKKYHSDPPKSTTLLNESF